MTTAEIIPPPFALDVRVARSPLVGLRYGVDGRATDIDDVVGRLEALHAEVLARREEVHGRLGPYDASRRAIIERLIRRGGPELRQRLEEGLDLHAELASLDEQLTCLRERIAGLREQRTALAGLGASLASIDNLHEVAIDGPGAAENQAVRQLFHLIRVDHDSSAQGILEGPMQLLADAAFRTELVGRAVSVDAHEAAVSAASARRSTSAALDELHRVVFRLHPETLAAHGLEPALRRLLADVGAATQARVVVLGSPRRVRPAIEMAVFRIVQEAVANSVAHGHAKAIEVVLLFQPQRLAAVIRDDGEGFDVSATEARLGRNRGLGLIGMRQRAEIEGGHLEVRSVIGEGTEVRASFPT